jgi:hypothetical protein
MQAIEEIRHSSVDRQQLHLGPYHTAICQKDYQI